LVSQKLKSTGGLTTKAFANKKSKFSKDGSLMKIGLTHSVSPKKLKLCHGQQQGSHSNQEEITTETVESITEITRDIEILCKDTVGGDLTLKDFNIFYLKLMIIL
jgi:hypothetical protein